LAEELRTAPTAAIHMVATNFQPIDPVPAYSNASSLDDVERRHIESVLNQVKWKIEGEHGAARILAMNPSTLRSRMLKLGISRPSRPSD
jgi:formate hydrogenlyase transcriptional activator